MDNFIANSRLSELPGCNTVSESVTFEVKRATGQNGIGAIPEDFYRTYSAFAQYARWNCCSRAY